MTDETTCRHALARERNGEDVTTWGHTRGVECIPCRGWAVPSCVTNGHELAR